MKSIVVAYDQNNGIGSGGDLPWGRQLPADLKNFKRITTGGTIIMGRKTFQSIGSRPLPNRQNIVLSSEPTGINGVITAGSLDTAFSLARFDIFLIGGERIFKESLEKVDRVYATEVQYKFNDIDVYFTKVNNLEWAETNRIHHPVDKNNKYSFDFVIYDRKS